MPNIGSEQGGLLDPSWFKHVEMEEKRKFSQQFPALLCSPPAPTPLTHLWEPLTGLNWLICIKKACKT